MKISNVYVGGWFQRTMLQLSEIYDFLRDGKSQLKLKKEKLIEFQKSLEIGKIDYGVSGEEYIQFTTALGINVKIFEDGLIILNNKNVSEDTLNADINKVTDYYEKNYHQHLIICLVWVLQYLKNLQISKQFIHIL